MDSERAKRLRKRFIMISTLSFMLVMLITGTMVNVAYSRAIRNQMIEILDLLVSNEGELPIRSEDDLGEEEHSRIDQLNYGMRYFSVILGKDSEDDNAIETVNLEHVNFLSKEDAESYAKRALDSYFNTGSIDNFYFKVGTMEDGRVIVAFVNSSIQMRIREKVVQYTMLICGIGLLVTAVVVWLFSKRAIRSELETAARQKEFITNASHELKTPLAVIRANTEIMEMTGGETEWTQSTLRQVEHMNGLIQNLVMITRSAEREERLDCKTVDVSKTVKTTVEPFLSVAKQDNKELSIHLEEEVAVKISESDLRQLTSILTDNALKYCDENGQIHVSLSKGKRGKGMVLAVSNSYKDGGNVDYHRFFDRFYREDTSHQNQKGYGIGLSMAESICRQYRGKIHAEWKEGIITFICNINGC